MWYEVCDTDSCITWPYQIADHNCRITWVYNKSLFQTCHSVFHMFNIITCCLLGCLLLLRSTDHCVIFALNMSVQILTRLKNSNNPWKCIFKYNVIHVKKQNGRVCNWKIEKRGDYFYISHKPRIIWKKQTEEKWRIKFLLKDARIISFLSGKG